MGYFLAFLAGTVFGVLTGTLTVALLAAAGRDD